MTKPDFYLRAVLTVIALSLATLALHALGVLPSAQATAPTAPASQTLPASYGLVPTNPDGSISVRIVGEIMPVNIKQIDGREVFGNMLPVDIRAVDGSGIFNGALPVQGR